MHVPSNKTLHKDIAVQFVFNVCFFLLVIVLFSTRLCSFPGCNCLTRVVV